MLLLAIPTKMPETMEVKSPNLLPHRKTWINFWQETRFNTEIRCHLLSVTFKQDHQIICMILQIHHMEVTCCNRQDVLQDVGFERPDYRAAPTTWCHNHRPASARAHVEGGNALPAQHHHNPWCTVSKCFTVTKWVVKPQRNMKPHGYIYSVLYSSSYTTLRRKSLFTSSLRRARFPEKTRWLKCSFL